MLGATPPIHLPGSHGHWRPVATAEGWDGGSGGACNQFLYDSSRVKVANTRDDGWRPLSHGLAIKSSVTRVRRTSGHAFVAAEGTAARRLMAAQTP